MATRTRRTGIERRAEIAAAALRLLGQGGLPAVSSAAIAAEVGVSPAALFRHYDDLPAILAAAVDLAVARLDGGFPAPDAPPLDRLRDLATARVSLLQDAPGIAWLLRSEQAQAGLPPLAVEALRGAIGRSRAFIHAAIRDGIACGALRRDVSPRVLLTVFTATIHALVTRTGIAQQAAGRPDPDDVLPGLFALLVTPVPPTSPAPPEPPR